MDELSRGFDYKRLGERLRARRLELHMTQEDLLALTGISASHLSNIENGKTRASIGHIFLLANALQTNFDYLLYDQYDRPVGLMEKIILQDLRELSEEEKQIASRMVRSLVQDRDRWK